jgi:hypothetical protein
MKVGDLVRYKHWWGGHIGCCIRIGAGWDGVPEYLFYWYTDGTQNYEKLEYLEVIACK